MKICAYSSTPYDDTARCQGVLRTGHAHHTAKCEYLLSRRLTCKSTCMAAVLAVSAQPVGYQILPSMPSAC